MYEESKVSDEAKFSEKIEAEVARKLKAQHETTKTIWLGLGMSGLIGWSVAIPIFLGAALGVWLDKRYPSHYSWTLMLLMVGLIIGCLTSWHWINSQYKQMYGETHE